MKRIDSKENPATVVYPQFFDTENGVNLSFSIKKLTLVLFTCHVLSAAVAGQGVSTSILAPATQLPAAIGVPLKAPTVQASQSQTFHLQQTAESGAVGFRAAHSPRTSGGVQRITLDEAQQLAGAASSPLVHLGELQVEAAKQHRLGVQSLYFPNLSSQFDNLHFNKHPGEVFALQGPLGRQHQVAVNIFDKNETVVNLSVVQPLTPLMAIHQLVKIARADENIARAKAGMPVTEAASRVEKTYYDLLVAQRELVSAEAESKKIQGKWLTASSSGITSVSTEQEKDMITAEKAIIGPASKVKELTAALDEMLGLAQGTTLELVPPDPLVENVSLTEVTEKAMVANPEVIEAEQTSVKAHAASAISKMEYGPNVAIVGGYANQTAINTAVFPRASGYLGLIGTFTVFDFGKREHGVKEAGTNAKAADLGVELVKAKVAAAVKNTYFELERSRQFTQLARRMMSATRVVEASYQADNPEVESARAKVEAEMFRAELEYRQAYGRLKSLMGDK
ncbi:MAG TPA: TolC family protein [Terriglobales bacterium]|nr:TolC family protein [Terriglobales bacterium]